MPGPVDSVRLRVVLVLGFITAAAFSPSTRAQAPSGDAAPGVARLNILVILCDDLGIHDLACYGRQDHRTPHVDRLAADGVLFTCAYAAQPICSPSRAALLTGKCPARLHLTNYLPGRPDAPSQRLVQPRIEGQLPLEEVTLPELLKQAGYATGLFGKWHLGGEGFGPLEQGFDEAVSPPANPNPTGDASEKAGGKGEFAIAAAAESFITEHRNGPFFCYVAHNSPHIPLAANPQRFAQHADAFNPTYAAMIESLDESVGRLLAKIESLGLAEQTLVVFTSDNGGLHVLESPGTPATHNGPYRAGKGFFYEGGLRVPLVVRWPGVTPAGAHVESPLVLTDLMPTLLEAAGIDSANTVGPLDGASAMELLRGASGAKVSHSPLFWHFPNYTNQGGRPAGAIRDGDWKLIENFEDDTVELYNLADDVGETRNLAAAEPARVAALRQKLRAWRTRVGAAMPTPNPEFDATLHQQLYVDADPSKLKVNKAADAQAEWSSWREAMNAATRGREPAVTPATGDIRLHAKDARVHGKTLRYEPEPHKNVLGYWTNADDWAEWEFDVAAAGDYEVEIQQGCGDRHGGATVNVEIGDQTLSFVVQDTGHFQHMILRTIGQVALTAGRHRLAVKPQSKPGAAVMDLRRIVLRPVR